MPDPKCPKCGAVMQHYCGMACVDMCPVCDFGHTPEPTPGGGEREVLKPCPACHEAAADPVNIAGRTQRSSWRVMCSGCECAFMVQAPSKADAIIAWNARIAPAVTLTSEESEQVALTRKYIISLRFDGDHIRALLAIIDRITGAKP